MKKAIVAVFLTTAMAVSTACGTVSLTPSTDSAASGSELPQESPSDENTETAVEEVVEYSADDILDMLDKNPLNASRTLKGNQIYLTGKLSEIDADGKYIKVSGMMDYHVNSIKCYIKSNNQLDYIAKLSKNEGVRIFGRITEVQGETGYTVEIKEIEKYKPYPWFTINKANCDYTEYKAYPTISGDSILFPEYWKDYLEIEQDSQYLFAFAFNDDEENTIKSFCSVSFTPCDDYELADIAEELNVDSLSVSDDESKFELLSLLKNHIEMSFNGSIESQDAADPINSMKSSYIYINNNPALKISNDSEYGYYETIFVVYPDEFALATVGLQEADEYHADELFNSLLSIDQDIPLN